MLLFFFSSRGTQEKPTPNNADDEGEGDNKGGQPDEPPKKKQNKGKKVEGDTGALDLEAMLNEARSAAAGGVLPKWECSFEQFVDMLEIDLPITCQ